MFIKSLPAKHVVSQCDLWKPFSDHYLIVRNIKVEMLPYLMLSNKVTMYDTIQYTLYILGLHCVCVSVRPCMCMYVSVYVCVHLLVQNFIIWIS